MRTSDAKGEAIRASTLRKIPHLKTCPAWDEAEFMGRIFHTVNHATYDGALVKYKGTLYYINIAQVHALVKFVRWNLKKAITVIDD